MNTPSFLENHISQIPALLLLVKMGWTYLTPSEVLQARGDKLSNVLLEDVLRKQLHRINAIQMGSSRTSMFSDANIENGIIALKTIPFNE
jgi:type I restriction enzyme R subunit